MRKLYTVQVLRHVQEIATIEVGGDSEQEAIDQALEIAEEDDDIDWGLYQYEGFDLMTISEGR